MKSIPVSVGKGRTNLRDFVEQAKNGVRVTITTDGQPVAVLEPVLALSTPWRVEKPDVPSRYGDLQKPVLEPWL